MCRGRTEAERFGHEMALAQHLFFKAKLTNAPNHLSPPSLDGLWRYFTIKAIPYKTMIRFISRLCAKHRYIFRLEDEGQTNIINPRLPPKRAPEKHAYAAPLEK